MERLLSEQSTSHGGPHVYLVWEAWNDPEDQFMWDGSPSLRGILGTRAAADHYVSKLAVGPAYEIEEWAVSETGELGSTFERRT